MRLKKKQIMWKCRTICKPRSKSMLKDDAGDHMAPGGATDRRSRRARG